MTNEEVISTVNKALIDEFELEKEDMKKEAHLFNDLGFDSLDVVDMVIVIEKAFGFKVRDEEGIKEIRTLEDLYDFIIALDEK